jgi:hypothetical protein
MGIFCQGGWRIMPMMSVEVKGGSLKPGLDGELESGTAVLIERSLVVVTPVE